MKNLRFKENQRAFTKSEYEILCEKLKLKNHQEYVLFQLMTNSSLYYTDISYLTIQDLKNILKLEYTNDDGLLVYDFSSKFSEKKRRVYLNSEIKDCLEAHLKWLEETLKVPVSKNHTNSSSAFYSRKGAPIRHDALCHYVDAWCSEFNIEKAHPRKTFFMNLLNNDVSLQSLLEYSRCTTKKSLLKYLGLPSDLDIIRVQSKNKEDLYKNTLRIHVLVVQKAKKRQQKMINFKNEIMQFKKMLSQIDKRCSEILEDLEEIL